MTRKVDSRFVWIDGRIVPADEAKVSFFSHAVHYGTGVFEGIRCYETEDGPAVFRLPEHLQRLRRSARAYFMEYPWSDEQLTSVTSDLIRRHGLKSCYIRPVVLTGEGAMGVRPRDCEVNVYIAVWSWGAYLGPEALARGVRTCIVSRRKYHPTALDPTVKAIGHYLNSVVAAREAFDRGYDEGLLLNQEGRVAEGPGENLFIVRDEVVWTNPPEESLLLGVTRDTILRLAGFLGLETRIAPITPDDLLGADEAFFTGSAAEVTPVVSVDDVTIGEGGRGPITERLQTSYLDTVHGRVPEFRDWLTQVEVTDAAGEARG